jgi:hypothetical protein
VPAASQGGGCSADNRGASIVGSAPVENAYLILELAKPWPKKVKAQGAIAEFKPLLKGSKEEVKLLATPRIDWLPLCQRPWALLVRWKDGQALIQELPGHPEEIKAALDGAPSGHSYPLYLVCTHGTRDRCCGTLGFPVYRTLVEKSSRKVLQVSHLGGHRFAPVVLALPEWRFFGHMDTTTCLDLDAALAEGRAYLPGFRGHGRLPEELQPIEAKLWEDHGPNLCAVTACAGLGSPNVLVKARFGDGTERAYQARMGVQQLRGFKSCEDIAGGKSKTSELPALESLKEVSPSSLQPS